MSLMKKPFARMPTKKSYSWWWDSHINPRNSKWLADNLEEMNRCVKEMLRLIEGEGDSFAKKADMYYQRRPDLIAHVEDFYRMYRALAERYDNVTGELRKNVPSELQSQGSGNGSDFGSEPDSPSPEPIPKRKPPRPKLGPRPPGFDFFLGSAGSSDHSRKGSDRSSSSESDSDSEDSKHANGDGDGDGGGDSSALHQRIQELENELHITIEKLHEYEEKHFHDQDEHLENGDHTNCTSKISALEKQLMEADEEILNMKQMLEEKKLSSIAEEEEHMFEENRVLELEELNSALEAKISLNKQEIEDLKTALASANQQFEADISRRDDAFEALKTELSSLSQTYLNERIRLEGIIANLEGSISNLKEEIKHLTEENSLLARKDIDGHFLIRELQANAATSAEQYLHEKTHLEGIIADLEGSIGELKEEIRRISEHGSLLESKHIDQDGLIQELQANAATSAEQFSKERCALEARLSGLSLSHDLLEAEVVSLVSEITQMRAVISEQLEELSRNMNTVKIDHSPEQLEELSHNLNTVKIDVDRLSTEKEEYGAKVNALIIDVKSRDERINELNGHQHQLHLEHVKLITELEETRKDAVGLRSRVSELEEEVERQRAVIVDSAEGKREAIRQLCFSLEHYQHGYRRLRRVLQAHKWPAVVAT